MDPMSRAITAAEAEQIAVRLFDERQARQDRASISSFGGLPRASARGVFHSDGAVACRQSLFFARAWLYADVREKSEGAE